MPRRTFSIGKNAYSSEPDSAILYGAQALRTIRTMGDGRERWSLRLDVAQTEGFSELTFHGGSELSLRLLAQDRVRFFRGDEIAIDIASPPYERADEFTVDGTVRLRNAAAAFVRQMWNQGDPYIASRIGAEVSSSLLALAKRADFDRAVEWRTAAKATLEVYLRTMLGRLAPMAFENELQVEVQVAPTEEGDIPVNFEELRELAPQLVANATRVYRLAREVFGEDVAPLELVQVEALFWSAAGERQVQR